MGNSSISTEFKSGKWKRIQNLLNRQVLQNTQTHMKIQKHYARSDFQSFDDRFQNTQLYNWRKSLDSMINIVKLYEFQIKEEMFSIQQQEFVYTENINRFNKKSRPYSRPQGFLLIMDFLKGLLILYGVFGYFNIDISLLGVSQDGKGKVWVNENYAKNQVEEKNVIQEPSQSTQKTLVNNLIRLVSDKVYNEQFMPQISYPWNMNIQQAIEYVKAIRNENILFQMQKVYSDRNQFKSHFDSLYQRFLLSNQNSMPKFLPVQNNDIPLTNISREQNKKVQTQKANEGRKMKNDPSQTLSSDSNSRSKTNQYRIYDEEKIEPKKINNLQPINIPIHEIQLNQQKAPQNFNRQVFIVNRNQNQIPFVPPYYQNYPLQQQYFVQQPLPYYQEMQRPSLNEPRPQFYQVMSVPQVFQRVIEPKTQVFNEPKRTQYIQRKIIKYRTLNQAEMEQQIISNSQGFNKMAQKNNFAPQYYTFNPNRSQPINYQQQNYKPPHQRQNTYHTNLQRNMPAPFIPQNPRQFQYDQLTQSQKLINNVELCQSVIFDQAQLLQNLKDLDN